MRGRNKIRCLLHAGHDEEHWFGGRGNHRYSREVRTFWSEHSDRFVAKFRCSFVKDHRRVWADKRFVTPQDHSLRLLAVEWDRRWPRCSIKGCWLKHDTREELVKHLRRKHYRCTCGKIAIKPLDHLKRIHDSGISKATLPEWKEIETWKPKAKIAKKKHKWTKESRDYFAARQQAVKSSRSGTSVPPVEEK